MTPGASPKRPRRQAQSRNGRRPVSKTTSVPTGPAYRAQFQHLADAIVRAPAGRSQLSHEECDELIEFYVDGEMRGEDVRRLYPMVFAHLQTCRRCALSHALLTDALLDDSSAPAADKLDDHVPTTPPFAGTDSTTSWTLRIRSGIGGAPRQFGFVIHPDHVKRVMAFAPSTLAVRAPAQAANRTLLLSDTLAFGRQEYAVQAWASRSDRTHARIVVSVASSEPLPGPLRATLKWDAHHATGWVREGETLLDSIPIAELEQAKDVALEFEPDAATAVGAD